MTAGAAQAPSDSALPCTGRATVVASAMVSTWALRFWICTLIVLATLGFFALSVTDFGTVSWGEGEVVGAVDAGQNCEPSSF